MYTRLALRLTKLGTGTDLPSFKTASTFCFGELQGSEEHPQRWVFVSVPQSQWFHPRDASNLLERPRADYPSDLRPFLLSLPQPSEHSPSRRESQPPFSLSAMLSQRTLHLHSTLRNVILNFSILQMFPTLRTRGDEMVDSAFLRIRE